jgi:hypothetical protein
MPAVPIALPERADRRLRLALAMADSRPHAALLATELAPPFAGFLDAHVWLLKRNQQIDRERTAIIPKRRKAAREMKSLVCALD